MTRKGFIANAEKLVVWTTLTLPALLLITGFLYYTVEDYKENNYPYPQIVEDKVVEMRLLYNQNCLATQGQDGRVYPGTIDISSLSQNTLSSCLDSDEQLPVQVRILQENSIIREATTPSWENAPITDPRRRTYIVNLASGEAATAVFRYK